MTEPLSPERLDDIRGRADGRYASTNLLRDLSTDRDALLAEVERLTTELSAREQDRQYLADAAGRKVDHLAKRVAELEAASEQPSIFPWARWLDQEDQRGLLADLEDAVSLNAVETPDVVLARVESALSRWWGIASADHAQATAPGPDTTGHDGDEQISCSRPHCQRTEWYAVAAKRGWEPVGMGQWLDPQCAADAADRREP